MNKTQLPGTGIDNLDRILNNLNLGDNVVWQVDTINDYKYFVTPYVERAVSQGRQVIYIRFADHEPLVTRTDVEIHELDASEGFENFSKEIYTIITRAGREAFYVFDCLSFLLNIWATDLMIGNFFVNTCPYLYELDTLAYFALFRNVHNVKAVARIRETTQVLLDLYHIDETFYIHPLKVENRYSPTMFFPHILIDGKFLPINTTDQATHFINHLQKTRATPGLHRQLDFWDRIFLAAEDMASYGSVEECKTMVNKISSLLMAKDERILSLVLRHFTIQDFLQIRNRQIGTGYIGGKSTGMLLARKILLGNDTQRWQDILEYHDSWYIGSDVFYSYIIQNGLWRLFMEQRTEEHYYDRAEQLADSMKNGRFPDEILEQFRIMLDYFGQSPIIVRSSSLLEDGFGNAFAGKYESYFLTNQGNPEDRLRSFIEAVRMVYASTMSRDALTYRLQRGLDKMEEQMALLIMRVSGSLHDSFFYPDMAGVGLSYNAYTWKEGIDPEMGMLRIVTGLGTRAVDRRDSDYARIVSLGDPMSQPVSGMDELRKYGQKNMDVLNIETNSFETRELQEIMSSRGNGDVTPLVVRDFEGERMMTDRGLPSPKRWRIDFDSFLSSSNFADTMSSMMKLLENEYYYPVDIEFTLNFTGTGEWSVNLLQCRPHQAKGAERHVIIPDNIPVNSTILASNSHFLGGSTHRIITKIVYVDPSSYHALSLSDKYETARVIGRLTHQWGERDDMSAIMLVGPGRWGTSTPSLGVPVGFYEISTVSVLVEMARMSESLVPELSFGTHFFLDLVETDIFYMAFFPEKNGFIMNDEFFNSLEDRFTQFMPDQARLNGTIKVFDLSADPLTFQSDIASRKVILYRSF